MNDLKVCDKKGLHVAMQAFEPSVLQQLGL